MFFSFFLANLPITYRKLICKGEPYRYRDPSLHTDRQLLIFIIELNLKYQCDYPLLACIPPLRPIHTNVADAQSFPQFFSHIVKHICQNENFLRFSALLNHYSIFFGYQYVNITQTDKSLNK